MTQRWGNPTDVYAKQFDDPNFKAHNGIDANNGKYTWERQPDGTLKQVVQTEYAVYRPVDGFTVKKVDFAPQGGGNELWLISNEPLQMLSASATLTCRCVTPRRSS